MPTLNVTASGFSPTVTNLNGVHSLQVSKRRCMKFAASIGLPLLEAASPTSGHAMALAAYKALAIKCAIDFTGISLNRPPAYRDMDQSEKANISYWIGMTFGAIVADELLNVTCLLHASAFGRMRLARVNPKSRRLADLVGQDPSGDWHVVEAKARQTEPSNATRTNWKKQARTVSKIDGVPPVTRSYSLACVGDTYSAKLVDPPAEEAFGPGSISINFEQSAIIDGYYRPIFDWLTERTSTIERQDIRLVMKLAAFDPVDDEYIFLGLEDQAVDSIRRNELPERLNSLDLADAYIGADGIALVTSHEPEVR